MTNHWVDLKNSDCLLIMGSNAAENHPISMRWVMKAKENGATVISVDPRFTRTSAVADIYAALRSGTDIAFLGGMINYILEKNKYFKEYVDNYTNASYIVGDKYNFNDGLFSGYDAQNEKIRRVDLGLQEGCQGRPGKGPDLAESRVRTSAPKETLFSVHAREGLRNHRNAGGRSPEGVRGVFLHRSERQSRERAVRAGLDASHLRDSDHQDKCDHSVAAWQYRHCRRRHQRASGPAERAGFHGWGSSVPSYSRVPEGSPRIVQQTLEQYLKANTPKTAEPQSVNWWSNTPKYTVSLLKSFYGDKATKENDLRVRLAAQGRRRSDLFLARHVRCHVPGQDQGYVRVEPKPGGKPPQHQQDRESSLRTWIGWFMPTSSTMRPLPSGTAPGMDPKKIKTEVFLLPAACSVERDGSLTNSGRLVQWRYKAVEPPGDAIADGEMVNRLIVKLKELYKKEGGKCPDPILNLKWDYVDDKGKFDPHKMAKECNGYFLKDVTLKDPTGKDVSFQEGRSGPDVRLPTGRREHLLRKLALLRELHQCREHDGPPRKGRPHRPRALSKLGLVLAGEPASALQPGFLRSQRQPLESETGRYSSGKAANGSAMSRTDRGLL